MITENRRSKRQAIGRHAKIEVSGGALPRDCLITDISDGGVRLHVEGVDVPDRFVLLLSEGGGSVRPRVCIVVWRLGHELGVEFTDTRGRGDQARNATPQSAAV